MMCFVARGHGFFLQVDDAERVRAICSAAIQVLIPLVTWSLVNDSVLHPDEASSMKSACPA